MDILVNHYKPNILVYGTVTKNVFIYLIIIFFNFSLTTVRLCLRQSSTQDPFLNQVWLQLKLRYISVCLMLLCRM